MGTDTKKIRRQLIGASTPPRTNPMNIPPMAAAWLIPMAVPLCPRGKASVRMAPEFAISIAAPTPWKIRITISQIPAASPDIHVMVSSSEKKV